MQESGDAQQPHLDNVPTIDKAQRTQEYVQQQAELDWDLQQPQICCPVPISLVVSQPATTSGAAAKSYKDPSGC